MSGSNESQNVNPPQNENEQKHSEEVPEQTNQERDEGDKEENVTAGEPEEKRKFKSIREMRKAIETKEIKIVPIQPQNLSIQQESFNIKHVLSNPSTELHKIMVYLSEGIENLKKGYEILMNFYGYQKRQKQIREEMAYQGYQLGDIEFLIVKRIGFDEDISANDITPNRMGMAVTVAAHIYWMENVRGESDPVKKIEKAKEIKQTIINPFALAHGFEVDNFESVKDPGYKMTYMNMVTTIGFDALTCYNPAAAVGIAAYRCSPGNPEKLGLDKGIPEGLNKETEIKSRCLQGILTKTFTHKGVDVKLEDVMDNEEFMKNAIENRDFLITFAKEPIKSRDQRAKKVFSKITEGLGGQKSQKIKEIKRKMQTQYNITQKKSTDITGDPFSGPTAAEVKKTDTKSSSSTKKTQVELEAEKNKKNKDQEKKEQKTTSQGEVSGKGKQEKEGQKTDETKKEEVMAKLKSESEKAVEIIKQLKKKEDETGTALTEDENKTLNDAYEVVSEYKLYTESKPISEDALEKTKDLFE